MVHLGQFQVWGQNATVTLGLITGTIGFTCCLAVMVATVIEMAHGQRDPGRIIAGFCRLAMSAAAPILAWTALFPLMYMT